MLLDTLIGTEITKFYEDRNLNHLNAITKFVDILEEGDFGLRYMKACGFAKDQVDTIISEFLLEGIVEENIHFECLNRNESGFATIHESICEICGNSFDEENHEIENWYKVIIDKAELSKLRRETSKKLLDVFLEQEYKGNYELLKESLNRIVPMVGAGFSVPIGAPTWKELFLELKTTIPNETYRATYEAIINDYDFFEGVHLLLRFSNNIKTEEQLKVKACEIIEREINYNIDRIVHNYNDLLKIPFQFFLTTNYDNALNHFKSKFSVPLELESILDIQSFLQQERQSVIHLHGILDMPQSIVLTENDYINKYQNNETFKTKLTALMASKSLLFIGFSFSDTFFTKLYDFIQEHIRGRHFIISTNITSGENTRLVSRNIFPIVFKLCSESERKKEELIYALRLLFNCLILRE